MLKKLLFPLFVLSFLTSFGQSESEINQADYVFRHVNVLPISTETILKNQILGIQKGKIVFILDDNFPKKLKTKAQIIQGKDKYLMPGMADMHCHFPEKKEIKNYFLMNLLAGVTHLRSMRGAMEHLDYRKPFDYPKPYLQLATQAIGENMNITEVTADSLIKTSKENGFDLVKVLSIKDSVSFFNLMTASKKYSLPVAGHHLNNINRKKFYGSGYATIEHLWDLVDAQKMGDTTMNIVLDWTKNNNISLCPTLDWDYRISCLLSEETWKNRAGLEYIADSVKVRWLKEVRDDLSKKGDELVKKYQKYYSENILKKTQALKKAHDYGINIIIGADAEGDPFAVPGFNIVEEMKLYSKAGLSNFDILKTATINSAKYAKNDLSFGTLEKGKNADMILLEGNPLENLEVVSKVNGIFINQMFYLKDDILKLMK